MIPDMNIQVMAQSFYARETARHRPVNTTFLKASRIEGLGWGSEGVRVPSRVPFFVLQVVLDDSNLVFVFYKCQSDGHFRIGR
jgi:hypothetical protein